MNINPKNLDALLNVVSKKMGTNPNDLRKSFENGTFDSAMSGLSPDDNAKLQHALNNPKIAERLISSPQAQDLIRKLMGGK